MGRIKNGFIVILVILALFQTEQLWFEEFSNRNFFLSSANVGVSAGEEQSGIVNPYRMIVNFGNNTYRIFYNRLDSYRLKQMSDDIIKQILKDGQFQEGLPIDWKEVLTPRSVLYEYAFSMPTEVFTAGLGQRSNVVSSKVKAFNALALVPNANSSEKFKVLFLDTENDISYQFVLNKNQNADISKEISGLNNEGLYYISSQQSGFDYFAGNIFIPQWPSQNYRYSVLSSVNPYGELLLTSVGKKVDAFFNNPAAKWENTVNGVYTYVDESVVVKYYPNHVLEYSNYETYDRNRTSSLISDYRAAVSFIARDRLVTNEYYLSGYTQEDELRTFYFDYAVNNVPLIISKEVRAQIEMDHPIEITVEKENVIRYRKLVYSYEIEEDIWEYPTKDFIHALDGIIAQDQREDEDYKDAITRLELGYTVDNIKPGGTLDINETLLFRWYFEINGGVYSEPAQQKYQG